MEYKRPLPSPIDLPEGYIVKRKFLGGPDDGIEYSIRSIDPTGTIENFTDVGHITAFPSELSDELITMGSDLNPEVQRKGIGRSIYKQAEKDTGKKIIPDLILSDKAAPLHKKYGLGNEFGLSSYEEKIKKGLEKRANLHNKNFAGGLEEVGSPITGYSMKEVAPLWPPEYADEEYKRIKKIMNEAHGLDKFKSIVPFLKPIGMGLTALGAAGYSDMAGAATDMVIPGGLEETYNDDKEVLQDRKYRSANLIPNAGMLGGYTDAPDTGRYLQKLRQLSNKGM